MLMTVTNVWVASDLKSKSHLETVNLVESHAASIIMEVSQGSTLAPVFFIIFIAYHKRIIYVDYTFQIQISVSLLLEVVQR